MTGTETDTNKNASVDVDGDSRRSAVATRVPALSDPSLYLNREFSWLEFNRRVLSNARRSEVPLLERLRFLSIFSRNLDEFFMVRVAGLKRQVAAGVTARTADGRSPTEQVGAIAARVAPMAATAGACLHDDVLPALAGEGIALRRVSGLSPGQRSAMEEYFQEEVFPVLTPLAVDPGHPFPYISNLSLSLAVTVRDVASGERHFARVKVPGVLPRLVRLPDEAGFVPLEDLIAARLAQLFPGMEVLESFPFRVTRNADLDIEEDEAEDLLMAIEAELRKRRRGAAVRLEVAADMPDRVVRLLQDELDLAEVDTYRVAGLLAIGDLSPLTRLDRPVLRYKPWHPVTPPRLAGAPQRSPKALFAEIRRADLLVHHPYTSFTTTVERFVAAASEDPDVLAIKQTLYRTSGHSPILLSLMRAAERGKQVVALVELKARFDEAVNIGWARALEKSGCHVVYGLVGLKTHAKTTLVVRRERDGIRRYVHLGTGNYHQRTARSYTDLGLFSADPELGADVTDLFNYLTGYARHDSYRSLLVAPGPLRERLIELIHGQIERHTPERPGRIRAKLNALIDPVLIAELYGASQAGVQIDLVVRGICGLRPGVPGVSETIRVRSVVGRLLEHSRILQFGEDDLWIGSPDWMPRNLDRRVEALAPVRDADLRSELVEILDVMLADTSQAWDLQSDGSWRRAQPARGGAFDAQAHLAEQAMQSAAAEGGRHRPRT
ncbi:MAG TPA: polyphosphate kinase 1 [Egibacteraceae bacterium]|nr:polyphosphate kinase 1 [Egibacteraceae bacterium]